MKVMSRKKKYMSIMFVYIVEVGINVIIRNRNGDDLLAMENH